MASSYIPLTPPPCSHRPLPRILLLEVIEVPGIDFTRHLRRVGGRLIENRPPFDPGEEGVRLDLLHPVHAKPLLGVRDELPDQVLGLSAHLDIIRDLKRLLVVQDLLAGLRRLVGEERRVPHEHLVEDDPERPPVDGLVVSLLEEDLRGDVIWGPNR